MSALSPHAEVDDEVETTPSVLDFLKDKILPAPHAEVVPVVPHLSPTREALNDLALETLEGRHRKEAQRLIEEGRLREAEEVIRQNSVKTSSSSLSKKKEAAIRAKIGKGKSALRVYQFLSGNFSGTVEGVGVVDMAKKVRRAAEIGQMESIVDVWEASDGAWDVVKNAVLWFMVRNDKDAKEFFEESVSALDTFEVARGMVEEGAEKAEELGEQVEGGYGVVRENPEVITGLRVGWQKLLESVRGRNVKWVREVFSHKVRDYLIKINMTPGGAAAVGRGEFFGARTVAEKVPVKFKGGVGFQHLVTLSTMEFKEGLKNYYDGGDFFGEEGFSGGAILEGLIPFHDFKEKAAQIADYWKDGTLSEHKLETLLFTGGVALDSYMIYALGALAVAIVAGGGAAVAGAVALIALVRSGGLRVLGRKALELGGKAGSQLVAKETREGAKAIGKSVAKTAGWNVLLSEGVDYVSDWASASVRDVWLPKYQEQIMKSVISPEQRVYLDALGVV